MEDTMKLLALVHLWSEALVAGDKERVETFKKVASQCVLTITKASEQVSDRIMSIIQTAENMRKKAAEMANYLPLNMASRLHKLRAALIAQDQPHSNQAIYDLLKTIKWSAEQSKVPWIC